MPDLIDVEMFAKELDAVVEREDGFRLAYVGRHSDAEYELPMEEFAIGSLPGPMILFELHVASEKGMTPEEALQLASMCKQSRDKLAGRAPINELWVPPA